MWRGRILLLAAAGSIFFGLSTLNPRAALQAIEPLAARNILLLAAAGNEAMDMDRLQRMGWSYWPCLIQVRVTVPMCVCVCARAHCSTLARSVCLHYST